MNKIIYISLGQNCQGVSHYIKNNFMKSKADGRKTCVFDLMLTSYYGLYNLIENDFENFMDIELIDNKYDIKYQNPSNVLLYSTVASKPYDNGIVCNKKYALIFNHESFGHPILFKSENWESKDYFIKNNFEEFKKRYNSRIINFKNYIEEAILNNYTIFFLLNTYFTPIKLKNIIIKKFPSLKFKIVCNKIDDIVKQTMTNFEKDICNIDSIDEILYDSLYHDDYIIMDGWDLLDKLELTLL